MVLARLGSLAGFAFPIGSPRKGTGTALEGMELDGGLDNSDGERGASPFNEGYGTRRTLPRDLSLKSGLCFEAARPFDWSRAVPAHLEAEGMMQHLREAAGVAKAKDEEQEQGEGGPRTRDEALAAWVAASYYYTHPADRLPAPQHLPLQQVRRQMEGAFAPRDAPPVAASAWQPQGGEGGGGEAAQPAAVKALYRRLREWEEAFRHLYGLYRHDLTLAASFYMVAPDFTVAWTRDEQPRKTKKTTTEGEDDKSMKTLTAEVEALLSQDEDEEEGQGEGSSRSTSGEEEEDEEDEEAGPRLKAVISTSKRWLRERLRAAGIPFTMPLAPDAAARDTDEGPAKDVREELDALRRQDWGVGGHGTVQLEIIDRRRRPRPTRAAAEAGRSRGTARSWWCRARWPSTASSPSSPTSPTPSRPRPWATCPASWRSSPSRTARWAACRWRPTRPCSARSWKRRRAGAEWRRSTNSASAAPSSPRSCGGWRAWCTTSTTRPRRPRARGRGRSPRGPWRRGTGA